MKIFVLLILTSFFMFGCVVDQGKVAIDIKRKIKSASSTSSNISSASVSNVQIINHQLVITGTGLNDVANVKVDGNSLNQNFSIESKSATQIIANAVNTFSFDVSKVFNLILSDANAAATFPIDFSLCNATLNGKGFNCAITANDKDVLSYDAASGKWKPRAISGITYQGAWDATTTEPTASSSGDYYIVNVANSPFGVGDWIVWNGSSYDQIVNSTTITSVFGRTGAIAATKGDYDLNKLADIDLTVPPTIGKVLKYDGAKWVAGDDLSGGGAGSVTTSEIAAAAVTDAKIDTVSASKITGTITSAQILDGTIVNADINAAAAIDYSKLNIPATSIPYAKLNIADGDIPAAKISGLPAATSVLTTTIVNADSTHAPDGNAVFNALAAKLNTTGGTLTVGTISGVPTPTNPDDVANKGYTDSRDALKVSKAGDTMSGILTLDNDLKIKGGANYVTIKSNAATASYNFILPAGGGTNGYILSTDGSGGTSWIAIPSASSIVPGTIVNADVSATAAIAQSKIANLTTDLAAINTTISSLNSDNISEGVTNLYFTKPRVLATDLAGLNTGVAGPITATDTVLSGFGKLQYQVTDLKSYGQWTKSGSDVVYSAGDVEVDKNFKLKDSGTNFVLLKAPAAVTATYTMTLPPAKASVAGQVLTSDTSGVLSWTTPAATAAPTGTAGGDLTGTYPNPTITGLAATKIGTGIVDNTEFNYLDGVTSSIQTQLNGKQATSATLTAFAAYNTNGILVQTAANTFTGRTITGTANRLTVTNGDGVASNPTINIPTALLPSPVAGDVGKVLKATAADTSVWTAMSSSDVATALGFTPVNKAGDSMSGDLSLDTKLRLKDSAANYVEFKAPAAVTATYTMTLPPAKASVAGQVLTSDTSGVLSWTTPAATAAPTGTAGGDLTGTYPNPTIATGLAATKIGTGVVDNTEFSYLDGVTSSIQTQLNGKQATSATLTAFAGYNTNGILVQTAANTFVGRSIAGTANRLTVTNGDGVAGNPTINIPTALLPSPVGGDVGKFLKATAADTSVWTAMSSSDVTTALGFTPINKAGDSMSTGTFTLSGTAVMRSPDPIGPTDVATKQYVDSYGQWTKSGSDVLYSAGDVQINNNLKLKDSGTNFVLLKAPAAVTTTYTLTMPPAKASVAGQVLTSDTSGVLSWTTPSTTAAPTGTAGGDLTGTYPNPTIATGLAATKIGTGVVDNTEFAYLDGVTSSIQTQLNGKQASNANLTALAAYNTNGILVQTAANTFVGRSIAGTTNRLTVTNGDGVAGNPTINIPTALLPSPVAGDVGKFLKATAADTSVWTAMSSSDVTTALGFTPINKAGDSMSTGTFTLSGTAVMRSPDPIGPTDIATKQYVDSYGQWTKSGSDIYRSSGNVGIGTTTPSTKLNIATGNGSSSGLRYGATGTTGYYYDLYEQTAASGSIQNALVINANGDTDYRQSLSTNNGSGNIVFMTGAGTSNGGTGASTEKMRINGQGNVGIGTTSPGARLDVSPTVTTTTDLKGMISGLIYNGASAMANYYGHYIAAPTGTGIITNKYALVTEAGAGNVGIGTTSPSAALHVVDQTNSGWKYEQYNDLEGTNYRNFRARGTIAAPAAVQLGDRLASFLGAGHNGSSFNSPNGGISIFAAENYTSSSTGGTYLTFGTSATGTNPAGGGLERMRIDSNGNVGIGMTSPTNKLDVNGTFNTLGSNGDTLWTGRSDSTLDISQGSSSTKRGISIHQYSTSDILAAYYYTGGGFQSRLRLDYTGNLIIAGTLTQSSDERLKKDITRIPSALDKLTQLEGVTYFWKDSSKDKSKQMGLIAQKVEKIFPEVIQKDKTGFLSIAYQNLVAPIIESIKEIKNWLLGHDKAIEENRREIASLKQENAEMKAYLCSTNAQAPFCKRAENKPIKR